MAIGLITNPVQWLLRQVMPISWPQNVQDNINALLAGTESLAGVFLDSIGGASVVRTADTVLLLAKNSAGYSRFAIDHNGLPGGHYGLFREDWMQPQTNFNTAGLVTSMPLWSLAKAGSTTGLSTLHGDATINHSTAQNNKLVISSTGSVMATGGTQKNVNVVLQTEIALDAIGANGVTYYFGFSNNATLDAATAYMWFRKASGDTNWQCETYDGVTLNSQTSGVAPVTTASTPQRLKIEYHSAASSYGAQTVRFFINEVLVATSTTGILSGNSFFMGMEGLVTGNPSTSSFFNVGPVLMSTSRFNANVTV